MRKHASLKSYGPGRTVAMALVATLSACGGGEAPAGDDAPDVAPQPAVTSPTAPTGPVSVPAWYVVDHDARMVALALTAGQTPDNNYWNYNGHVRGEISIVVPEGYAVRIELTNADPNMAHSLGIIAEISDFMQPPQPVPVFDGAVTENPMSMIDSTMPGESETIAFVADAAGTYGLVCFIPGHAAVGMWLFFEVSADGEAGVRGL